MNVVLCPVEWSLQWPKIVAIRRDDGGFAMKGRVAFKLVEQGLKVIDCGTHSSDAFDYPYIAPDVA